jgi:hypothetical protein
MLQCTVVLHVCTMMIIDIKQAVDLLSFCLATITSFCAQKEPCVYRVDTVCLFVFFSLIHVRRCCSMDVVAHVLARSADELCDRPGLV